MAVKFNVSQVKNNSSDLYQISEFNGVDYTTTPTKVDDSRAIDMSNYLPEGSSLVKRYGYNWLRRLLHYNIYSNYDHSVYETVDDETITYENDGVTTIYKIEDTINEVRVVEYANHLIVFLGRKIESENHYFGYILFVNKETLETEFRFSISAVDSTERNFWGNGNVTKKACQDYRCENTPVFVSRGKVWAFVFGEYFIIDYAKNGNTLLDTYNYYITRISSDGVATYGRKGNTMSSYSYFTRDGKTVWNYKLDVYKPTTILNFQPVNSTSNSVKYEQLNMLNRKFDIELYITFVKDNGNWVLANTQYDVGTIYPKATFTTQTINIIIPPAIYANDEPYYKVKCQLNNGVLNLSLEENEDDNTYTFSVDTTTTTISTQYYPDRTYKENYEFAEVQGDYAIFKAKLEFNKGYDSYEDIFNSQAGITYGVNNTNDRIFVSCGNIDYHTLDNTLGEPDYTYFGEETYTRVGFSNSDIIGYQVLNNGSLAIFKDNNDETSIFIREGTIVNTNETYKLRDNNNNTLVTYDYIKSEEIYSTISSGLLIKDIDKNTKFCLYDNKLIFNTKTGVYYLNLNAITSSNSYSAKELSYYIRNDLSDDLSGSKIITDSKYLYVIRKDKNEQLRVYVADKNEYSFINSEAQYNWWVLDGFPIDYIFTYDYNLYFFDEYLSLYKIDKTQMFDYAEYVTNSVTIGGTTFSTEVMFNTADENMIISPESKTWEKLFDVYKFNANIEENDLYERYKYIKENVSVKNPTLLVDLTEIFTTYFGIYSGELRYIKLEVNVNDKEKIELANYIANCVNREIYCTLDGTKYTATIKNFENWSYAESAPELSNIYEYEDDNKLNIYILVNQTETDTTTAAKCVLFPLTDEIIKINELYTSTGLEFSNYVYRDGYGWYDLNGDFVAEELVFNIADFTFKDVKINFYNARDSQVLSSDSETTFVIKAPIVSKWYSKFTSFGRQDVLKTTKAIHFIPETRRGGFTKVGYRTRNNERLYESNDVGLNFNFIDFESFSFEGQYFSKSYSSKKKIRNFSFIQLMFISDEYGDSTISSITIKYMYGKENRGVK